MGYSRIWEVTLLEGIEGFWYFELVAISVYDGTVCETQQCESCDERAGGGISHYCLVGYGVREL